jgi:cysteinyl-tRNA synthetase
MELFVYNVLTRKKEEFIPQEANKVKMYACGITVSDNAHIGHAYQAIVFDMIKKYLEYKGYDVTYVRNYTDVDDKIILKARELGIKPLDYANNLINKIDEALLKLGVDKPTIQARATECINDMIDFIQQLINKGHAYVTEYGDVYFSVNSFDKYGEFSNRIISESLVGVRKEIEPGKKDDKDFALWKNAKNDEIFWDSPWGAGRPGWHIECSAMSMKYLGETLDIHGGGKDLLFPHHENEIAQSEALTNKQFSKYWMHNGLVKINGQKMSKSLGNSILLDDLLKNYNSDVIRITLLQNNYRSDINVIDGMFEQNEDKVYQFYKMFNTIDNLMVDNKEEDEKQIKEEFENVMDNDFNSSSALALLFGYFNEMNKMLDNKNNYQQLKNMKKVIIDTYKVLGILQQNPKQVIEDIKNKYLAKANISEQEIISLIEKRKESKLVKDFDTADKIRGQLNDKGIIISDNRDGVNWDIDCTKIV